MEVVKCEKEQRRRRRRRDSLQGFQVKGRRDPGCVVVLCSEGEKNKKKEKTNPTLTPQVKCCDSPHVSQPLPTPLPPRLGGGGRGEGGHTGEACKPLLSVCSRVICQLSCSARQSLGEIATYSAASSFSPLSWTWARTLGSPLLSLILDTGLSSFLRPFRSFSFSHFVSNRGKNVRVRFAQMLHLARPQYDEMCENKEKKELVAKVPAFQETF